MMESEEIAKEWLKKQGYTHIKKIERPGYPDFMVYPGFERIEVKTVHKNNGEFTEKQHETFSELQPDIIIVKDEEIKRITYEEVLDKYYTFVKSGTTITLPESIKEKLDDRKVHRNQPYYEVIEKLLSDQIRNDNR